MMSKDDKLLNFAVIGAGYWGPNLARVIDQNFNCDLKIVIDKSKKNLENLTKNFKHFRVSTNISDLDKIKLDCVAIATPPETHYEIAKSLINKKINILVAKPLCLNIDEAKELYELSIKNNVEILIDETFIYSNQVKELKRYVNDKNSFGELTFIDSTRVNLGLFQQNTNVIWDLAPHEIAISSYVLGEYPTKVRATSINALKIDGVEESYANCEYYFEKTEVLMTSLISWLSPIKLRRMVFGGTNQTIVYDHLDYEAPLKIFNQRVLTKNIDGVTNYDYSIGSQFVPHIKINEPLKNEIEQIVLYLKEKNTIFPNNKHAYNSVSVLTSLIESAKNSGSYQEVKLI